MAKPKKVAQTKVVEKPVAPRPMQKKAPGTASAHGRSIAATRAGAAAAAKAPALKPMAKLGGGGIDIGKFAGEVSANIQGALGTNKASGLGRLAGGWAPGSGLLNPKKRR